MTAVPVAASATSGGGHKNTGATQRTNSTLGVTTPISMSDVKDTFVNLPTESNRSQSSAPVVVAPVAKGNLSMSSTIYSQYLSMGQYMPCVTVARVTKHLWVYNGFYFSHSFVGETWLFSNPDEQYPPDISEYMLMGRRYGSRWSKLRASKGHSGRATANGMHEFIFEVYYGGYARGWALEYAEIYKQHKS